MDVVNGDRAMQRGIWISERMYYWTDACYMNESPTMLCLAKKKKKKKEEEEDIFRMYLLLLLLLLCFCDVFRAPINSFVG